ncbi:2-keto-4-pentenoate hydratase [Mycolicibacterium sp. Y3]
MALSDNMINTAAAVLETAQRSRVPAPPLTESYPGFNQGDAYAVQRVNLRRRLEQGRVVVGHKVGLTSAAMQQLLGVDQPDFGYILDDMVVPDNAVVAADQFCAPRVEPEVAFLLRAPLRGPHVTIEEVYEATESVASALEIVDSRIADWRITLPDTVADNASSGAVVLGTWVPYHHHLDLPGLGASLLINGVETDTGMGTAVMGDPAAAVTWLANALAAFSVTIEPGQFVMSGSFTSARFIHAGDTVTTDITGLGAVSLRFS